MTNEIIEQPATTQYRYEELPLSQLTGHPGNVREDLQITDRFRRSIRQRLVTPLMVTPQEDGTYRVIDGHRRLLVIVEDKWKTVPVVIDESRAADQAGQFLDMLTTADQRVGLKDREKAAALFNASALGADAKRMAAHTGWTQKEVKTAVRVGGATKVTAAAKTIEYDWTLDQLAEMIDFEDDPQALERLATAAADNRFNYILNKIKDERAEAAELNKEREQYAAAGLKVIEEYEQLPEKAARVNMLRTVDGESITAEDHRACRGHVVAPSQYSNMWMEYCTNPALYDHHVWAPSYSTGTKTEAKPDKAARQRTIQGNKDYKAATAARREWLKGWVSRKTFPRDKAEIMARFVASAVLQRGDFVTGGINSEDHQSLMREWLGLASGDDFTNAVAHADTRRLPVIAFMSVVAACEKTAGHKSNRGWRTDGGGYEDRTRNRIGSYFTILAELGHVVAPVEQAVIDDVTYDGVAQAAKEAEARKGEATGDEEQEPDTAAEGQLTEDE
ncbi:ParB/RepB/Spo0J family partition protein [Streptomyces subrutilus]|uniref:ParB-like N-terminal domain-containing protein n=1 Tax=Streptomyces subrutilus TaxID=36818 RepID=A0A1E5NXE9_9ACTN|nr:ParB/RepB/Spo0J family partition protein [Streptomyces subrutilus]OEJ20917.1 hypothetical protein BGK67_35370 [Streptomyces subrutilus]